MPSPYISRPKGSPDKNCMVYLLAPGSGADAYMLYASASGEDKWKTLYEKIEAETDALRDAHYIHTTLTFADNESNRYGASDFLKNFNDFCSPLVANPDSVLSLVFDDGLGDAVIAMITVLPLNLNRWCQENT